MAVGDIISAARYNLLQTSINQTLGTGAGLFGYGETVRSVALVPANQVNATHMQRLKEDITDCYAHQTGSLPVLTSVAAQNDITNTVYIEYETLTDYVSTAVNRLSVDSGQTTTSSIFANSRTTAWGGVGLAQSISHEFTVTFANVNARRHFFNSGGQIRMSASLVSGSNAKSIEWGSMLNSMKTIIFDYQGVSAESGTPVAIGNYDLTNAYQNIYTKNGSGTYSQNSYVLQARGDNGTTNVITFKANFNDDESGFTDEDVTGTITSSIAERRATGLYVSVVSPVYQTILQL
jgi:hypothetical protein